jgi:MFS family permease
MSDFSTFRGKGLAFLGLLWSMWFFVMVVRMIMGPILPVIEDEFLVRHAKATSLVSLFALGSAISTLASGLFAGKIGYRKSIILCLTIQVVVFLIVPHVRTFFQLTVLLFMLGLAWGTYFPCVVPIVTGHYAPAIWGRALAMQDSGASFSALAAPLLATLMLRFISWHQFFYVFAAAYLVLGIIFALLAKEVKVEKKVTGSLVSLLNGRSVWIMGVMWICASGAFWGVYQVMPLYFTKELHLSTEYANTVFGLSRIGGIVFGITMGFIVDRFSLKKSMFVVMFLTGVCTVFIGYPNLVVVEVAMFLQGTTIGGYFAIGLMAISRAFSMSERGLASGVITTIGAVFGSGLTPYLFGLAGDHISFKFGILAFGVVVIFASGLVYFLDIPDHATTVRKEGSP